MSDTNPNDAKDDSKDESKDEQELTLDLDQAHDKAIHELDKEEELDEEGDKEKDEDEEKNEEEGPEDKDEEDDDVSEESPADSIDEEEDELVLPIDETKISVKDSDGNVQEFDSLEDIPDDFEPFSYKEFGLAVGKLTERGIERKAAERKAEKDQKAKEKEKRLTKMKKTWDDDLEALIKEGEIDKDDNKEVVDGVYKVMQEELLADRPASSFRQAYEIYSYRENKKAIAKHKEKLNKEKKARGAKVQPGGSGVSTPSNKSKVFEAPPSGVSLDQVHEKVLNSLQLIF